MFLVFSPTQRLSSANIWRGKPAASGSVLCFSLRTRNLAIHIPDLGPCSPKSVSQALLISLSAGSDSLWGPPASILSLLPCSQSERMAHFSSDAPCSQNFDSSSPGCLGGSLMYHAGVFVFYLAFLSVLSGSINLLRAEYQPLLF